MDASRPARRPADSVHHRRPAQREPAVRRGARPSLRTERRARRLSIDRRRPHLREGAGEGREHRRLRSRIRSEESRHRLRRACGSSARARGKTARGPAPNGGIFKSTDGGTHMASADARAARRRHRPGRHRGRAGRRQPHLRDRRATRRRSASIARTMRARAGRAITTDYAAGRPHRRRRSAGAGVDPKNPDTVIIASTVSYGSRRTAARRGPRSAARRAATIISAPWINPDQPEHHRCWPATRARSSRVNGGETWSSWYNQPTAQIYHVNADNAFPYRVCGGQQESGSACVASRGNDGEITFRDWHPVGVEEYGYAAPDPLNPDIIYGGKVTRLRPPHRPGAERRADAGAPRPTIRTLRTAPVVFSHGRSARAVLRAPTRCGRRATAAAAGQQISPDLTRKTWEVPATIGKYSRPRPTQPTQRGVIYTVAPSPLDINRIWAARTTD